MVINKVMPIDSFYRNILELIRTLPPLNKLRPKEIELLAEIMRQNDSMRNIDKDKRRILIFSTENRKEIHKILGCNQSVFNNNLSILKKHKLLNQYNELIPILDIDATKGFSLQLEIKSK